MLRRAAFVVSTSLLLFTIAGCTKINRAPTFAPPPTMYSCGDPAQVAQILALQSDEDRKTMRNAFVVQAARDLVVGENIYMGKIQDDRAAVYSLLDVGNLGATAAAGAVGGPAAAKAFALGATAVAGIKGSYATNFDAGGNSTSLVIRMQGSFSEQAGVFKKNLDLDYYSLDLPTACGDLFDLWSIGQKTPAVTKVTVRSQRTQPAPTPPAPATPVAPAAQTNP